MAETNDDKNGLKIWIAALAFSMLLLAATFAILATYLADIKDNTLAAVTRTDFVTQRLNTLDMEVAEIHHYVIAGKTAPAAAAGAPAAAIEAPAVSAPAAPSAAALPAIQSPTLAEPAPPVPGAVPAVPPAK